MSQFSTTRLSDKASAAASNAFLQPAIAWLRANTPMGRLSELEVYETLAAATSSGGFAISQNSHSVP